MKSILHVLILASVVLAGCTTREATLPDGRVLYRSARFATNEKLKRVEFRGADGSYFLIEGYGGNQTDAIGIAAEAAARGAVNGITGGATAMRSGPPAVPPGYKLVPKDDPSSAQPEIDPGFYR